LFFFIRSYFQPPPMFFLSPDPNRKSPASHSDQFSHLRHEVFRSIRWTPPPLPPPSGTSTFSFYSPTPRSFPPKNITPPILPKNAPFQSQARQCVYVRFLASPTHPLFFILFEMSFFRLAVTASPHPFFSFCCELSGLFCFSFFPPGELAFFGRMVPPLSFFLCGCIGGPRRSSWRF